jgi:hypothetical protein
LSVCATHLGRKGATLNVVIVKTLDVLVHLLDVCGVSSTLVRSGLGYISLILNFQLLRIVVLCRANPEQLLPYRKSDRNLDCCNVLTVGKIRFGSELVAASCIHRAERCAEIL